MRNAHSSAHGRHSLSCPSGTDNTLRPAEVGTVVQMKPSITDALSPEQQRPLGATAKNICILASAGSGKTRTLTHLLASDLAEGIPPSGIIAFTFTEKAADELLARVHALALQHLPELRLQGMYIGTIHAWCLQYLRNQSEYYNPEPMDELHADALVSRFYDALGLSDTYGMSYPRAIAPFLSDLEILYNEHLSPDEVPDSIRPSLSAFLALLTHNRLMTYGGMIRSAVQYLSQFGPVAGLQSLYVDEYQDVNPAQVQLIKVMLPQDAKLTVVGDDLQCIYDWRGSDVSRILNFQHDFGDSSVYQLRDNYRSRPSVVDFCNAVAQTVQQRVEEKVMKPKRSAAGARTVRWITAHSEAEEAAAVGQIVENLIADGVPPNSIAILLRSVLNYGQAYVAELNQRGIDVHCPILSRGGEFINGFLIPLVDWLRNDYQEPNNRHQANEIEEKAKRLWEGASRWIPASVENPHRRFWLAVDSWRQHIEAADNEAYDVRGRLYDLLSDCAIGVRPNHHNLQVGLGIASQIIRSVEEVHRRRVTGHSRRSPTGVLAEVYFALKRHQDDFGESLPLDAPGADGVLVTTVHQAKGLEWPVVILPMLVSRRFPTASRGHGTSYSDEVAARYGTSLDDERRLFYVAVTRAKERLFLLDPKKSDPGRRSRFLKDLQAKGVLTPTSIAQIDSSTWRIPSEALRPSERPPVRLGLSDLLLCVECPYQFSLRRIVGIQPSVGEELGFGKSLHELIQRRLGEETDWTGEDLLSNIDDHVHVPYMSARGAKQARDAIKTRIVALQRLNAFEGQFETEVDIEALIEGGIVHGVVDIVEVADDASLIIRDWKSNIHQDLIPRYERQLRFYAWALREMGYSVTRAAIVDVGASKQQGRIIARDVDIERRQVSDLIATLEEAMVGISNNEFDARPSARSCGACDVFRVCSARFED